jgi:hypothetical protein
MQQRDNTATPPRPPLSTAIAVLLDETGSMDSCRDDAIAGFNAWLRSQQELGDPCTLTLVTFSDRAGAPLCRLVHEGLSITEVAPLTRETYTPGGNTPLYDAVVRTIRWMDRLRPRPERVLMVILTDGAENASREHTLRQVHDLIREREATGHWTFVYLAANQDAWATGGHMGIGAGNIAAFLTQDAHGAFGAVAEAIRAFRSSRTRAAGDFWRTGRPSGGPAPTRPGPRRRRR